MKKDNSSLNFGKKIQLLRLSKGLTQNDLAKVINVSVAYVSRLESGDAKYDDRMLATIREFYNIEHAPIFDHELEDYRNRLWVWNDIISADRISDARAMQAQLSPILELHFERDLTLLYLLLETRILFKEGNLPAAEESLNTAEALLGEASIEALHLYNRNIGFLFFCKQTFKTSLKHFLKSLEYISDNVKSDAGIFLNIGTAYACIGRPWQAILYLEQAKNKFSIDRTSNLEMAINNVLATCYTFVGEYDKAKKLFDISLMQAKRINDENAIGITLINLGELYMKSGKLEASVKAYNDALDFLKTREIRDKAQELIHSDKHQQMQALAGKTFVLIRLKDFAQCKEPLGQLSTLAEGNEVFTAITETASHLTTLDDSSSTEYIEEVAIPYFKNNKMYYNGIYLTLEICDILETHYRKRKSVKKALTIAAISRDIYKEVFCGAADLD